MLAPLLFLKCFGSRNKEEKNNKNHMFVFPIFWVVTDEDYHSSMKDKYPTFYVILYCLFTTLEFTDTNQEYMDVISNIIC